MPWSRSFKRSGDQPQPGARSAGAAGDEPELGFGDEGVDDVGDGGAFFVGELVEVGQAGVDVAAGCVERPAFGVVDALDAEDLRLGVSLGLISPRTAVNVASHAVAGGSTDPRLLDVAKIDPNDIASVRDALRTTDPEEAELFPPQSVRKWTYLELKAAYEMRDRLPDPLGVVEEIYADFDYPATVAPFVRYMPPSAGAPVGEEALYDRWSRYLTEEAAELTLRDAQP